MRGYLRAVNFDLDTKGMSETLGSRTKGYRLLRQSMKQLGFSHRQGSGYLSEKPMTKYEVKNFISKLGTANPWLANCTKVFDVTNTTGKAHDYTIGLIKAASEAAQNTNNPGGSNAKNSSSTQQGYSSAFLEQMQGLSPKPSSDSETNSVKKSENVNE